MAETKGINRSTIRHALSALERDAIIIRRFGVGIAIRRDPEKTLASSTTPTLKIKKHSSEKIVECFICLFTKLINSRVFVVSNIHLKEQK